MTDHNCSLCKEEVNPIDLNPLLDWDQKEAVELATKLEPICEKNGCHIALTGGLLYKEGRREDCDFVIYRIRQHAEINWACFWNEAGHLGLKLIADFGWCQKAEYRGKEVDIFWPECPNGLRPRKHSSPVVTNL